jgi:cytidine deaminase
VVTTNEAVSARPELIIGLVCPLGARIEALEDSISKALGSFNYKSEHIRLSDLLRNLTSWTDEADEREETRIQNRQSQAAAFRKIGGLDSLARAAITEIRRRRAELTGHPDKTADSVAYILRQLKHPKEIELLRRVYGQSFFVIAGHAPEESRVDFLADSLAKTAGKASPKEFENKARTLINSDQSEDSAVDDAEFRQNTRDAYPLADFFVNLTSGEGASVRRFIDLLFGHPFKTPTAEEMAMHQANAMALRSSDERRQVGAVIVKRVPRGSSDRFADATVVAAGMNEVPRRQGGYYWDEESPDGRDQSLRYANQGSDREERIKREALREIAERLKANKWLADSLMSLDDSTLASQLLKILTQTQFSSISEFMRQVHAEMAAIVDAAMRGVPVRECEMYVTTFPCHGCAKHIIAAGIRKVVYLEPYPKSRAEMLHKEEIALDPEDPATSGDKVLFVPFTGVAPRQFARLFSMAARGRKNGVSLADWPKIQATLFPTFILTHAALGYVQAERDELQGLPREFNWDEAKVTPEGS